MDNKRQLLTRKELAQKLDLTTRTVDRWVLRGFIEPVYHKLGPAKGRRVHFDWSQVCRRLGIKE